mmetsp:Transcript_11164/g.39553  ORF Transcript_11164/g.39553 Transcript_11164/m.39553 type:complete len:204 (-) Transcript_11164:428-1039(-)
MGCSAHGSSCDQGALLFGASRGTRSAGARRRPPRRGGGGHARAAEGRAAPGAGGGGASRQGPGGARGTHGWQRRRRTLGGRGCHPALADSQRLPRGGRWRLQGRAGDAEHGPCFPDVGGLSEKLFGAGWPAADGYGVHALDRQRGLSFGDLGEPLQLHKILQDEIGRCGGWRLLHSPGVVVHSPGVAIFAQGRASGELGRCGG